MKWIKRIFIFLLIITTATLIHYYLPQRDIVKVVDTEVKRMDINKGSPFWDRSDAGTQEKGSRDVRLSPPCARTAKRLFTVMKIRAGHFPST